MLIKLFIACMFIPSIIIDANDSRNFLGNPSSARVGKFFGLFSVPHKPIFPYFLSKSKNWRGALIFSLGGYPLIATSVEYNHVHTRDPLCFFCLHHPQQINTLVNQHAHQPQELLSNDGITTVNDVVNSHISALTQNDPFNNTLELPLNSTSILASATASLTAKPSTTTMRTQETLRSLKLEDYDVITFDPNSKDDDDDAEDVDERDEDALNRVRREIQDLRQESNDEMESTTIESSTQQTTMIASLPMTTMRQEDVDVNTFTPMLELPQKPSQDFHSTTVGTVINTGFNKYPYSSSKYPNAQYISITQEPHSSYEFSPQIQPPVKNYYNFYPSQPDYSHYQKYNNYVNYVPYCYSNLVQSKFTPSSYYNGWTKQPMKVQQSYYYTK
ncbi:unnamed protein product [Chironomus riparius]|uniref:Uncharacterized protein n=1 Tax=Chironomus riparius TaxID=315576 RepID=A0A9N9RJU7_9DIPT|nr:unnamed protein product [Chironomus riparius]